jgi:ankyrin repeat protein
MGAYRRFKRTPPWFDKEYRRLFHFVGSETPLEVVQFLADVENGRNRVGRDGMLPLHAALENGADLAAVRIIYEEFSVAVYQTDSKGRLTLHHAASHSTPEVVELLLKESCTDAARKRTSQHFGSDHVHSVPLHLAAARQTPSTSVVELLIQAWPQAIHEKNGSDETPFQVAKRTGVKDPAVLDVLANGLPNGTGRSDQGKRSQESPGKHVEATDQETNTAPCLLVSTGQNPQNSNSFIHEQRIQYNPTAI